MSKEKIFKNHEIAPYTSWKIGGLADVFYMPKNLKELKEFLRDLAPNEPITWLGAATNVLVRDDGIAGTIIYVKRRLNSIRDLQDGTFRAEAGVTCARMVQYAAKLGLDAAFLAGIPGTVGGALMMNAGAFGDEIWHYVKAVEVLDRKGDVKVRPARDFTVGYRHVEGLGEDEWFVAGIFAFEKKPLECIKEKIKQFLCKRKEKQPIQDLSCGSVFRNPPDDFAARLIEASGLKGKTIGGAQISEKHANFIINKNNALAKDIEALIQYVIAEVEKKSGVRLVPEVKILGG